MCFSGRGERRGEVLLTVHLLLAARGGMGLGETVGMVGPPRAP